MMVTFVAECEKKSLPKTRRVLDAFANRIGSRTWQTVITNEGLQAVQKLLRKTASKNTAVSCHWIRSRSRSELVWIVGNRRKFNNQGVVPVNYAESASEQFSDQQKWKTSPVLEYAATIAALFHDFGKANQLFQDKISPNSNTNNFEPYRHEWVSLRLFQAFVGDKQDDSQWLSSLAKINRDDFPTCFRDGLDGSVASNHPFSNLPPLAKLVAWLVLTHHKLPLYPKWKLNNPPNFENIDNWLDEFDATWNSQNCLDRDQQPLIKENWQLKKLPVSSMQWRSKACIVASKALIILQQDIAQQRDWLNDQLLTTHLARLSLMLADHHYSAQEQTTPEWQNPDYKVFANSDRKTKQLKQQLDEHLIGVAYHAQKISQALIKLNRTMGQLEPNPHFTNSVSRNDKVNFGWQDQACKEAKKISSVTIEQGFFGINMASTGRGKTLANAKIMAALGRDTGRIRFSVALGLRTLTLQTGREYRKLLDLSNKELAIAVGGTAVKQLFENQQQKADCYKHEESTEQSGSESMDEPVESQLYVDYQGGIYEHSLSQWTVKKEQLEKLIQCPVLVCTIDQLIPATEGTKGGRQIAPMLRLLTSDLVLDEPDDFGLEDLPALCRLVHWSGMLGCRVLLSTATMPPALVYALFQAYQEGWTQYTKANIQKWNGKILCAWFDEFTSLSEPYLEFTSFKEAHINFINKRVEKLRDQGHPKHLGALASIDQQEQESAVIAMAKSIQLNAITLHKRHQQSHEGKNISIGLVRMANINPLVAVAKSLLQLAVEDNVAIHYCIYHSRYPLAIRSHLEYKLDKILLRKVTENIWQDETIQKALTNSDKINHIFIVLASPVAEVGRDHDYDWAIIEPSSMRSIIQIAGRVLRHREKIPEEPNILLLEKNYKALSGANLHSFSRPGFESANLKLASNDLNDILRPEQYQMIDATQRIKLPEQYSTEAGKYLNLVELEHKALAKQLMTGVNPAKVWWEKHPHWCGEVQRQQRFRSSQPDEAYYLCLSDENSKPEWKWKWKNENVYPPKFGDGSINIKFDRTEKLAEGNNFWLDLSAETVYAELAKSLNLKLADVSRIFGEVRLIEYSHQQQEYLYNPNFGLYNEM
ncbi:MAG: type I-F CRISPR-associated helicase Cas3 [SAR324 cluster bacterium]|nr:type I-F CRISPR-associated helicase Cas3 [SAR324 cluster bacterium]MBL7035514.1 type I-F CRISPR-associated helicase Cas3 [SAR324 cluster bacterium]